MPLEIAVDSVKDAAAAAPYAARIELCRDLVENGLTPGAQLVREVRNELDAVRSGIELIVLVRPGISHHLAAFEVDRCVRQISEVFDAGADSVAIGAIEESGGIDSHAIERLIKACSGRPAVFHRAFDFTSDRSRALDRLIAFGIKRVLSAGLASFNAEFAAPSARLHTIRESVSHASGRIGIVACGSIRASNAAEFARVTHELHSSCRTDSRFDADEAARIAASLAPAN